MPQLLQFTNKGIYCAPGDFYIDPWAPVKRAVITHAHSDHARWGSQYYLAHRLSEPILKLRLGPDIKLQTLEYNSPIDMNGVKVSLHPAGHIIGSAQIRVEYNGEVWVASGDYKVEDDGISTAFEPVKCHVFITESTFGLPVYRWKTQDTIFENLNNWWQKNRTDGKQSIAFGYSLGKAQRILQYADKTIGPIYAHTAVYNTQKVLVDFGIDIYPVKLWTPAVSKTETAGALIVAPPMAFNTPWLKRFNPISTGYFSGWMQVRGAQRRRNIDTGFALSDHADWPGLLTAIKATEAQKVYVTHGYQAIFARYLNEIGIEAHEVVTQYGDDESEEAGVVAQEGNTL